MVHTIGYKLPYANIHAYMTIQWLYCMPTRGRLVGGGAGKVKIVDYVTATVFDMACAFSSSKHDRTLRCSMHTCGVCARLAPNFSSRPERGRARKKDGANFCDSENRRFCPISFAATP